MCHPNPNRAYFRLWCVHPTVSKYLGISISLHKIYYDLNKINILIAHKFFFHTLLLYVFLMSTFYIKKILSEILMSNVKTVQI